MTQLALPLKAMQALDIEQVRRQPSMTKAIALTVAIGGFQNDKDFCRRISIDPAVWARIKNGEAHFPQDRYEDLFDECGNEAPLIWLADRRGYSLTPLESEMERRERIQRERAEKLEAENALLKGLLVGKAV
jgi:hypothetical protein